MQLLTDVNTPLTNQQLSPEPENPLVNMKTPDISCRVKSHFYGSQKTDYDTLSPASLTMRKRMRITFSAST